MSLYLDLNAIRWLPPNAVNCDQDGYPKTFLLGNVIRNVVSSQSWKRQIRLAVEQDLDEPSVRTRNIPAQISDRLIEDHKWPADLAAFAGEQVVRSASKAGLARDPLEPTRTLVMPWLAVTALPQLVDLCEEHRDALETALQERAAAAAAAAADDDDNGGGGASKGPGRGRPRKKKTDEQEPPPILPIEHINPLLTSRTASISLCGRMLASVPGGHVDGALQVAPAIAVHQSDNQPDFFTTVEDLPGPQDSGGAHLQTQYRATSTLHHYATVNLTELADNCGSMQAAIDLIAVVIEAFVLTMPQAKRTSTAPHTLPVLVHYALRDRRPVSYAGAFDHPVRAEQGGYTLPSIRALQRHAAGLTKMLGPRRKPIAEGHLYQEEEELEHLGKAHPDLDDLINTVVCAATKHTQRTKGSA